MAVVENLENPNDFELTHHVVPGEPGRDHLEEMAETFVVELKRMRWSDERILAAFRDPFYAGLFAVYQERGEDFVVELVQSCRTREHHETI